MSSLFLSRRGSALLSLAAAALLAVPAVAQTEFAEADTARTDGVRICAGGDVTLGTNLDTAWVHTARARLGRRVPALPDPDSMLAPLRPLVADADIVLLNVEGALGDGRINRQKCAPGSTACFAFRSPGAAAGAFRRVNDSAQVVGNVANNHARDDGDIGRRNTLRLLDDAGVHTVGADTLATVVATAEGDTVAFLGFAQWTGPDPRNLAAVRRHVRRASARWPIVVVTMHMGAEGRGRQRTANASELFHGEDRGNVVAFAWTAAAAGADLVIGHGPHVMRSVEWQDSTLVFYSLGNLLTYGPFSLTEPMNRGAIACATLDSTGAVLAADLRSTRQRSPGIVSDDPSGRAAALVDSLTRLDFPATGARVDAETGSIEPLRRDDVPAPVAQRPRRPRP